MKRAADLRSGVQDRGFNRSKTMKLIASIPEIEYFRHPEFMTDPKAIERWLQTEYGRLFRVSPS